MRGPLTFNVSKTVIGDATVSGDLTFASGKGILFDTYGIKITDTYIQFGDDATAYKAQLRYNTANGYGGASLVLYNAGATEYYQFVAAQIALGDATKIGELRTFSADSSYVSLKATDDDGAAFAQVEIARMVSANDPYFSMGGSQQFKFYYSGVATFGGDVTVSDTYGILTGTAAADYFHLDAYNTADSARKEAIRIANNPTTTEGALMGFYGKSPVKQQAHIADATDTSATDQSGPINAIIDALKAVGLLAPDP
jgi:hypothetical protein